MRDRRWRVSSEKNCIERRLHSNINARAHQSFGGLNATQNGPEADFQYVTGIDLVSPDSL